MSKNINPLENDDLGNYLANKNIKEFESEIDYAVAHKDPKGYHLTFFVSFDGHKLLGSLLTTEIPEKFEKNKKMLIKGKISKFHKFKEKDNRVIPLIGTVTLIEGKE